MDHESDVQASVIETLSVNHDVVGANDPVSALTLLATTRPHFDIVVVPCCTTSRDRGDYVACINFVRAMFKRWPWISIVLLDGSQDRARLTADVLLSGVRAFLRKPFRRAHVTRTIERVARRIRWGVPVGPAIVIKMKRIFAFLAERVSEVPTLGELAARVAMSRSHFSRMFHAVAGMPLRNYVRELRLKRAHELLTGSALSLTTIALEAGFYDLPHFDKAFRHRIGISPREFRRRYALARHCRCGR